jgi:hypothetical protein
MQCRPSESSAACAAACWSSQAQPPAQVALSSFVTLPPGNTHLTSQLTAPANTVGTGGQYAVPVLTCTESQTHTGMQTLQHPAQHLESLEAPAELKFSAVQDSLSVRLLQTRLTSNVW